MRILQLMIGPYFSILNRSSISVLIIPICKGVFLLMINHAYYDIESGLFFAFSKCTIDLSFTYQSPLAEGLMDHTWGSIGISYLIN